MACWPQDTGLGNLGTDLPKFPTRTHCEKMFGMEISEGIHFMTSKRTKRLETVTVNELRRKPREWFQRVRDTREPRLFTDFNQIVGKLVPPSENDKPKRPAPKPLD